MAIDDYNIITTETNTIVVLFFFFFLHLRATNITVWLHFDHRPLMLTNSWATEAFARAGFSPKINHLGLQHSRGLVIRGLSISRHYHCIQLFTTIAWKWHVSSSKRFSPSCSGCYVSIAGKLLMKNHLQEHRGELWIATRFHQVYWYLPTITTYDIAKSKIFSLWLWQLHWYNSF